VCSVFQCVSKCVAEEQIRKNLGKDDAEPIRNRLFPIVRLKASPLAFSVFWNGLIERDTDIHAKGTASNPSPDWVIEDKRDGPIGDYFVTVESRSGDWKNYRSLEIKSLHLRIRPEHL
jgi:hypothetical protein